MTDRFALAAVRCLIVCLTIGAAPSLVPAEEPVPQPVSDSDLVVQIRLVGTMPVARPDGARPNLNSPVSIGPHLILIDQQAAIYRWTGSFATPLVTRDTAPVGLTLDNREAILNVAGTTAAAFVLFTSSTVPDGATFPVYTSPHPWSHYQVLYRYVLTGSSITEIRPVAAFQTMIGAAHRGGGMATLPDGRLLLSIGDNQPNGVDGGTAPQQDDSHVGKLLIVDPADGSYEIAARGFRNPQRLCLIDTRSSGQRILDGSLALMGLHALAATDGVWLAISDIGGVTAEEINVVSLGDVLDTTTVENFGWGRNADGMAREGTFHVAPGTPSAPDEPAAIGVAPQPEPGFRQPFAQFGREEATRVAITGPVVSRRSFTSITALFGDLDSGSVYATTTADFDRLNPVRHVTLVTTSLQPTTLSTLAGGRPDPRFFVFPDGKAGVLLEATGTFYSLKQLR
ncbi:hypothetical protein [Maioricimonas sp. JC845]|uniref:hypothetical protein n=1 Tax=Maioricimonas sp. JC845 TaxID=3232138 RepID=UPI003459913C